MWLKKRSDQKHRDITYRDTSSCLRPTPNFQHPPRLSIHNATFIIRPAVYHSFCAFTFINLYRYSLYQIPHFGLKTIPAPNYLVIHPPFATVAPPVEKSRSSYSTRQRSVSTSIEATRNTSVYMVSERFRIQSDCPIRLGSWINQAKCTSRRNLSIGYPLPPQRSCFP